MGLQSGELPYMLYVVAPPLVSEQRGMFNDIWETPSILRKLLDRHVSRDGNVDLPSLRNPLPGSHKLAGRTPLDANLDDSLYIMYITYTYICIYIYIYIFIILNLYSVYIVIPWEFRRPY